MNGRRRRTHNRTRRDNTERQRNTRTQQQDKKRVRKETTHKLAHDHENKQHQQKTSIADIFDKCNTQENCHGNRQ